MIVCSCNVLSEAQGALTKFDRTAREHTAKSRERAGAAISPFPGGAGLGSSVLKGRIHLRALARRCSLRGRVDGIERLARGHEQAIALGTAEADVAADLGQADAADELA